MIQGTAPNKAQNGVFLTAEKPPGGGGGVSRRKAVGFQNSVSLLGR